jgi:hypothetical protein
MFIGGIILVQSMTWLQIMGIASLISSALAWHDHCMHPDK